MEEPSADGVSIVLDQFKDGDTINVETNLSYNIKKQPNQFGISTEVFLDDKRIASAANSDSGEFTLRPSQYEDGDHSIRIVHVFTSGTGSLAEQMQREMISAYKDFQLIINRKPSEPPAITTATIENGSIKLTWKNDNDLEYVGAYLKFQFPDAAYKIPITKELLEEEVYIDTYTVLFPLDSNRSPNQDRSSVTYSIVFASEYEEISGKGATIEHDPSWIDVTLSFVDFEHYKVSWPKHPLYANFDSYRIAIRPDYHTDSQSISASTQGGTQLIEEGYSFGVDYFGTLLPETNNDPYFPSYNFKPRLDENSLKTIPNMDDYYGKDFIFNPSTQHYYLLAGERNASGSKSGLSIFEYSSDMEFISKKVVQLFDYYGRSFSYSMRMDPISHNFYLDYGYRNQDYKWISTTTEFDKFNLSKIKEFSNKGLSGSQNLQLRGNVLKTVNYETKKLTLTNVETNEIFYSLDEQGTINYLSDDGKYIYIDSGTELAVYKIKNNSLVKSINLVDPPYRLYSIIIYNDVLYYVNFDNSVNIINLESGQTITTIGYQAGNNISSLQYDSISNKLLVTNGKLVFLFDLNSGESSNFSYESNKRSTWLDDNYYLWLTNDKLIHSKGIYTDVK